MTLRYAAEDPGSVPAARRHPDRPNFILSALRGVLKQFWRIGYIDAETYQGTIDVEAVKGERVPVGRALTDAEQRALFDPCTEPEDGRPLAVSVCEAAMLAVLFDAGVQRAEAVALEIGDFSVETGAIAVRRGGGRSGGGGHNPRGWCTFPIVEEGCRILLRSQDEPVRSSRSSVRLRAYEPGPSPDGPEFRFKETRVASTGIGKHFDCQAEVLLAQFNAASAAHSSTVLGSAREFLLSKFLRGFLPSGVFYGSGEIIDSTGNRSGQQDLVLYRDDMPKIDLGGTHLFFAEGVAATIEVKSRINEEMEYHEALDQLASTKKLKLESARITDVLDDNAESDRVPAYLFTFLGPQSATISKYGKAWIAKTGITQDDWVSVYRPDGICVLNRFAYLDARRPIRVHRGVDENWLEQGPGVALYTFAMSLAIDVSSVLHVTVKWNPYLRQVMEEFEALRDANSK